ncbi:sodium-dependent transporter [Pseudodesulfovibrio senegalensis]|jgi:NSS family neurotransmitter:Na+ symporter|uniref:Transporter n=1 Tax=Pseudodesulfovibrio senegalensis TaxID=1721087 RepID=A0A6N6N6V2_9BACT|nr:sodium-dependent transporter [Pseudodesulfovibrio senegalensis]KAB1442837.1 sodium-dependent transporter [Pseudodesulfovibrio senegalensis]
MATPQCNRDGFATRLGVLTATLGSAVGLGNIWKFPYMTGEHGGATFLVVYILATLVVGLPVMISEIMLGRYGKANVIATWRKLTPNRIWTLVGVGGVVAAVALMAFYTGVVGWVFSYVVKAVSGQLNTTDPDVASAVFGGMVSNTWGALGWQWLVLALVSVIIIAGVSKGIEKVTKTLMPILFIMLLIVCARSLTLPKASQGLAFLFTPDFSKVTVDVVYMALGLAFFKLSLGVGTMMTYGSYFRDDANIPMTATRVMLADLTVSLLAGIAIFPAVFNYGFEPAAGPGLLFMTIPAVFSSMPGGQLFMSIFFILTAIATIGAMLSIIEVPVAFMTETWAGCSRKTATIATSLVLALFGVPATLSFGVMADTTFFGKTVFDCYDFLSSNILMPSVGLCLCVFVGWFWGKDHVTKALSNNGMLDNATLSGIYFTLVRFVSPVLVAIVLLKGLNVF